jgi:hypothetical protein
MTHNGGGRGRGKEGEREKEIGSVMCVCNEYY